MAKIFIVILLFLSACTQNLAPKSTPINEIKKPESTQILETQIKGTPSPTHPTKPTQEEQNSIIENISPKYKIKVQFDYISQSATVDQAILFTNNSSNVLSNIKLSVDTLRYPNAFSLVSAQLNSKENSPSEEDYYILFNLEEPLSPHEEIEIQISYNLKVPPLPPPSDDKKPGIFGFSTIQTNFVDWYPFIPPLDENGNWILHEPWFYGEYLVYDLADYYIEIELQNTLSNTNLAASTIPSKQDGDLYIFESLQARNFVWSVSPSYIVEENVVNGVIISTYTFPFHEQAGSHVLTEATKAIDLYSNLFSSYPRENLTIVEGDFLDGMEYDGLFFLGKGYYNLYDFTPQNYLTFIAAHETAHQWWYTSVANDQAIEPWLDESLCTYSEVLFYENYYPELVDWWWNYRVNFYQPEGIINYSIYEYNGFVPYRNATYLRGAKFLQALRDDIGDQLFFEILKKYATTKQNLISSEDYFLNLIEEYSGEDPITKYQEYLQIRN